MLGTSFSTPALALRQNRKQRSVAALSPAVFYDPSDLSTLFQDSDMTIPVTAGGQAVGALRDKSGNGHHLTQADPASRPTYHTDGARHWLTFDGGDDYLGGGIVHGATRSVHIAVRYDSGDAVVFYGGRSSTNLRSMLGTGLGNAFGAGVGTTSNYSNTVGSALTGLDRIVYLGHDATTVEMWTNEPESKSLTQSGQTTPGQEAFLGAMNNSGSPSSYFGGRFYGLIETATVPSDADKATIRSWLEARI